eukprot:XP_012816810.1 PREDICTED: putative ATP-dependent RNA helicase TDRD12 isoform X1 [Xenopus tropicalis]
MYEVAVLQIQDPSCFWCEILKSNGQDMKEKVEYEQLYNDLNCLYGKVYRNVEEIKPAFVSVGEFCMVFCEDLNSWCRAILNAPACSAEDNLVECFLVDHAIYCPVKKKNIRLPVEACHRLPFRAKKFKLHQIQPVSLCVDLCGDKAELGVADKWDAAAIEYFKHLLKESVHAEAKLFSIENNILSVYLYIVTTEATVCVNDELVAKSFACFCSDVQSCEKIIPTSLQNMQPSKEVDNPAQMFWPEIYKTKKIPFYEGFPINEKDEMEPRNHCEKKPEEKEMWEENHDFDKLLQIINPEPIKLSENDYIQKPRTSAPQYPIFVRKTIEQCCTLKFTSLTSDLKKELVRNRYCGPSFTESYSWPSVAQGFNTIVISPDGMKPMNYIPPLLTFLHLASAVYTLLPSRNGPLAAILCSGWKKAHFVHELLLKYSKHTRPLNPMLILVGLKEEECENLNIRKGCEVIVTTPPSLLRYLKCKGLLLLRLCHLVLDEVDILFLKSGSQVIEILELFKKSVAAESRECAPQQIVATGTFWHKEMNSLLQYTTEPQVIITRMEQAAVYGNVQQVIQLCLNCEKISVLLRNLDFTPDHAQKVLIFVESDEEAELVHKAVQNHSIFSLVVNRKQVQSFSSVLQQWKNMLSRGTHIVLVVTNEYLPLLEVTDATCIIHFSFPENENVFGLRLYSLLDYIHSKTERVISLEDSFPVARSVLLMTEKHIHHSTDILRYLQHTEATIPPELSDLTQGILQANENRKFDKDICQHIKTFGVCRLNLFTCPDRHNLLPSTDHQYSMTTTNQYISVVPVHVLDPVHFFGRIVTKEDVYTHLLEDLNKFYQIPGNQILVQEVNVSQLYAVQEGSVYHRVKVFSAKKENGVLNFSLQFIDDGRTDKVRDAQLLQLPSQFEKIPPQSAEFIVCRVQPIDNEAEWDPIVTRTISKAIKGKLHTAKVVLHIGNTYWLDPMVQRSKLSGFAACINELNVRHEILSTGMGVDNPQHISHLEELLKKTGVATVQQDSTDKVSDADLSSNNMIANCCVSSLSSLDANCGARNVDLQNKLERNPLESKSLQPEVKWFQKDKAVILTIKLHDVTDHACMFYASRVVFSCYAGGKHYVADLELCEEILNEECECCIKNGEPVITLLKAQNRPWKSLLKQKHPNVSLDFDKWEDSEDSDGFPFVSGKPKCLYKVVSEEVESSEYSESDTESD